MFWCSDPGQEANMSDESGCADWSCLEGVDLLDRPLEGRCEARMFRRMCVAEDVDQCLSESVEVQLRLAWDDVCVAHVFTPDLYAMSPARVFVV